MIEGLTKSYGKKTVLRELNYSFEEGKIYSIIGRNGAGKTTFFNCVNQDEEIDSGNIRIQADQGLREPTFEDIGVVAASPVLPEFLTGYEFINYFVKAHLGVGKTQAVADEYFSLLKIEETDKHKLIKFYSYGMQNKLQLMCCLIRNPKVILSDEPLSSFDIIVSHDIKELLLRIKQDHIIIMTTHIVQLATDISDQIVILRKQRFENADGDYKSSQFQNQLMELLKE